MTPLAVIRDSQAIYYAAREGSALARLLNPYFGCTPLACQFSGICLCPAKIYRAFNHTSRGFQHDPLA